MKAIDAHAHIFRTLAGFGAEGELRAIGGGRGRWATGREEKIIPDGYGDTDFTAESLIRMMDENGIEGAMLLQGGFLGFENDYLAEVRRKHPDRFQAAATFDPYCRKADAILTHQLEDQGFRYFKFEMSTGCGIMGSHPAFRLDSALMMGFYERIAAAGGCIIFDLGSPGDDSNQPDAVSNIAEAFPSMPIVVCHLMSPKRQHRAELERGLRIMDRDNIFFDLAALFHKVRPEEYPFPRAREFTALAIDLLGAERLMWGSDAPSTVCSVPYSRQLDYLLPILTDSQAEKIFFSNARMLYFPSV